MSRRSFLTAADASTVVFDADQSKNFQVTLAGNRSLVLAGGQEGDEIGILLIQDSTGSRVPSWPSNVSWPNGQAPNLTTAANGSDLITLVKKGSSWQPTGGTPTKLPSRVTVAALATVVSLIAGSTGTALFTSKLSVGSGSPSDIGKVADNRQVFVGSGANATMTIKEGGSGTYLLSSSGAAATGIGVGVDNLKAASKVTDANAYMLANGTISGATLTIVKQGAGSGKLSVTGSAGSYICMRAANGVKYQASISGGAWVVNAADANTCP